MARVTQDSYAAGLFDGEGHVCFFILQNGEHKGSSRKGWILAKLSLGMCNQEAIGWLKKTYGGFSRVNRTNRINELYEWSITGEKARVFAKAILPYSLVKRNQLELWIEAMEKTKNSRGKKITNDLLTLRENYASQLLVLRTEEMVKV